VTNTRGTVIIGRSITSNAPGIAEASEQVAPLTGPVLETHTVSVVVAISVSYAAHTLGACCSETVMVILNFITSVVAWSVIEVTAVVLVVVVALTCTIVVEEGVWDAVVALLVRRAEARRTSRVTWSNIA
jgi:hypothetical protein